MITWTTKDYQVRSDGLYNRVEGWCLSTDEKPESFILNGSALIEMDTGKIYFYDEANAQWLEFGG